MNLTNVTITNDCDEITCMYPYMPYNPVLFTKEDIEKSNSEKFYKLPEEYIINKNATILFWDKDDKKNKTIVKLSQGDKYDKRLGFLIAYFQKNSNMTKTQANKYLDSLITEEDKKGN